MLGQKLAIKVTNALLIGSVTWNPSTIMKTVGAGQVVTINEAFASSVPLVGAVLQAFNTPAALTVGLPTLPENIAANTVIQVPIVFTNTAAPKTTLKGSVGVVVNSGTMHSAIPYDLTTN